MALKISKNQNIVLAKIFRRVMMSGMLTGSVVLMANLILQSYYADRIMPGTIVANIDVGSLTRAQVRSLLNAKISDKIIYLSIDDKALEVRPTDIGVQYDEKATIASAYHSGRSFFKREESNTVSLVSSIDNTKLDAFVEDVTSKFGILPNDAQVLIEQGEFKVHSDTPGYSIDPGELKNKVALSALIMSKETVIVHSKILPADVTVANVRPAITLAAAKIAPTMNLKFMDKTYLIPVKSKANWITFSNNNSPESPGLQADADVSAVRLYVQQLAARIDIKPVDKKVTVENGISKTTREGVMGSAVDQEKAVQAILLSLDTQRPLEYAITPIDVAFKTVSTTLVSLDYGRYIEVNLSKQYLWVWEDHKVVFETPITSGATGAGYPTVTGLFNVYYKTTNTHLKGYAYGPRYNYDVQVDYWMPFYSGYGMHDASWRTSFGGPDYYMAGSHGCVNLPDAAAAWVYNWSTIGTPVWVHN